MIHLVCADTTTNNRYGFVLTLLIIILDPLLIVLSYALILRSVLRIASQVERLQALNNCLSHILAVLVLYVPMVGVSMTHHFANCTCQYGQCLCTSTSCNEPHYL